MTSTAPASITSAAPAFDARDPFAAFNPSEKRVEGGATVGGRIIKDKLFFLLNFDLTHRNVSDGGQLRDGGRGQPHDADLGGMRRFPPRRRSATPSMACCRASTAQIPRTDDNDLGFGRLDYHPNDKNTFTAELNFPALVVSQRHPDRPQLHHGRGH